MSAVVLQEGAALWDHTSFVHYNVPGTEKEELHRQSQGQGQAKRLRQAIEKMIAHKAIKTTT